MSKVESALEKIALPVCTEQGVYIYDTEYKKEGSNYFLRLYIDKAVNPELETEIFVDADYTHMPLRDYEQMWSVMNSVVRDYNKIGKRNKKKDDSHLNKHAMHLIRLFLMAIDILEKGVIKTHRKEDLELLRNIRSGAYMRENHTFTPEFYDILTHYEAKLEQATKESTLPDNPDMEKIEAFVEYVNRKAIKEY